jgi:hypothetical protein
MLSQRSTSFLIFYPALFLPNQSVTSALCFSTSFYSRTGNSSCPIFLNLWCLAQCWPCK